ncbi:DUF689-domain-containing protein [Coniochaeta sp. PMI_546]|nr:DUF689-domain-containing protein [Coniochaeta sp. PMI_546]
MSPSFTIDFSDDFDVAPAPAPVANGVKSIKRNLLLAPPSVAAHEEKLRDVFTTFDRSTTDLQMLDRLSAGLVHLPPAAYDLVVVLTNSNDQQNEALRLLTRDVFTALVPSMKSGAKLLLQNGTLGATQAREAILAGLLENDGVYVKVEEEEVVVPLRFGANKRKEMTQPPPKPQNGVVMVDPDDDLGEYEDGDELIDEDDLLSEEDLKRPQQQPPECAPEPGQKKRRRACKDCSCGLAERLQAEDEARKQKATQGLQALKLQSEDLNELDFTVKGKTGSCNSCSLGDAFRCAGCPYLGLPAFKPGEEVRILNEVQL